MAKHRTRTKPDIDGPVAAMPMPPVAEVATDYEPAIPEIVAAPDVLALPAVAQPITTADRISCGKVIARKLSIAPAAAQEQARLLQDTQVRAVLDLQLADDARERIRGIVGA
jgi:hypothetical protein